MPAPAGTAVARRRDWPRSPAVGACARREKSGGRAGACRGPVPADAATPARMRLISQEQYFNSLGYVFGPDIRVAAHFAPFRRTDGLLASGSAAAGVTLSQMQEFQRTASSLAEQVVEPGQPRLPRSVHAARARSCRSRLRARIPPAGGTPAVTGARWTRRRPTRSSRAASRRRTSWTISTAASRSRSRAC